MKGHRPYWGRFFACSYTRYARDITYFCLSHRFIQIVRRQMLDHLYYILIGEPERPDPVPSRRTVSQSHWRNLQELSVATGGFLGDQAGLGHGQHVARGDE